MTNIIKRELELNKESEVDMYFSIMLSLLVMKTEYSTSYIKLNEIQAIEMVDNLTDGGIVTFTLKGDKSEQIVYAEDNIDKWNDAKEWMDSNVINLSREISKTDLNWVYNQRRKAKTPELRARRYVIRTLSGSSTNPTSIRLWRRV